jgi:hypothetical protein
MQVAYNRGRYEQQKRVSSSRPYLMYDAINDSRTRPNHLLMDNTILHRDDPWWKTHYPPCGYRCRCTVISLTEAQAQKRGVSVAPPQVDPDEGWDFNPGEEYQTPLEQTLASFGQDLVNDKPRLGKDQRGGRCGQERPYRRTKGKIVAVLPRFWPKWCTLVKVYCTIQSNYGIGAAHG